jgi:hypothetical protein
VSTVTGASATVPDSDSDQTSMAADTRHVLLFGASNLVLGWPALMRQLQQRLSQPLQLHACLGMGRSYLRSSRCLQRVLPGVLESRIWQNLPTPAAAPPLVLLTDVGNDIIYRYAPPDIQQAVGETVQRIRSWDPRADIVLTGLPLAALNDLTPFRFLLARRLLFQGSPLTLSEACEQASQLQHLLTVLAADQGLRLVHPDRAWYGLDPIHYRRGFRDTAFATYFDQWAELGAAAAAPAVAMQKPSLKPPLPVSADVLRRGHLVVTPQPVFRTSRLQVSAW